MAKYSRYDPRNKKNGRHKSMSLQKDPRIKEFSEGPSRHMINEVMFDNESDNDEYENQDLKG
ncbi:MAG TPA: hypothetical protein DCW83_01365 [Saprospirales bacterium]|jgi:hypothetical protein|nr:hypothetical protein [Saprospirales bacterium]